MKRTYNWHELFNIPDTSGVYAWYYIPEITDFDINQLKVALSQLINENSQEPARALVKDLLYKRIFSYFQQEPYFAKIEGRLKPSYFGELQHEQNISQTLIDRIIENPDRLSIIRDVIALSFPEFASPLYIGMAEKLRGRIKKHKELIERYRESSINLQYMVDTEDQSFALRICERKIVPTRLFVVIQTIDSVDKMHVDIENMLNRMNFPLLGRN